MNFDRKRKPKDPCKRCFLHKDFCLCSSIPSLSLRTKISLIIHKRELKRTSNTGRLAIEALTNSEMRTRGEHCSSLELSDLLTNDYQTLLLYPTEDATPLTKDYVANFSKPIQLIVPDGNWRQASKVNTRHKELANVPRVKVVTINADLALMRKETTENGMATLQAIAYALGTIEGANVKQQLLSLYEKKLLRTLQGRGTMPASGHGIS